MSSGFRIASLIKGLWVLITKPKANRSGLEAPGIEAFRFRGCDMALK